MNNQSRKINLLHTEWSDGWGGQEIRIHGEALEFKKLGHTVRIAARASSQLFSRAKESGLEVHAVNMHKGIAITALMKLVAIILKYKIDVVHTHSSVDARLGGIAGRLTGRAIVRSRHLSTPISRNWSSWFLYMRLADHIITSGASIRNDMIKNNRMISRKITSIPAGADETVFRPRPIDTKLKEKLDLNENNYVIGIVAVLRSWKGHEDLFKAIAIYKETNPRVILLVLGDGPQRENLEELRSSLGLEKNIYMLGHITDTPPYYSIMDVVILTSHSNEATSQTLPQAMLMGKVVIGTNVGSIPEVVIDQQTGLLIPPKNPDAIARTLEILFEPKKRNQIAQQGRMHAINNFTKKIMIRSTYEIYEQILQRK